MSDQSKLLGYRSGHSMGFGCAGIEEEAARLRRDLSEAVEVLRRVEWEGSEPPAYYPGPPRACPCCGAFETEGKHGPDCELYALLAKCPPKVD